MKKTSDNKENIPSRSTAKKSIETGTAERIRRFIEKLIFSPAPETTKAEMEVRKETVKGKESKKSLQVTDKNHSDSSRDK